MSWSEDSALPAGCTEWGKYPILIKKNCWNVVNIQFWQCLLPRGLLLPFLTFYPGNSRQKTCFFMQFSIRITYFQLSQNNKARWCLDWFHSIFWWAIIVCRNTTLLYLSCKVDERIFRGSHHFCSLCVISSRACPIRVAYKNAFVLEAEDFCHKLSVHCSAHITCCRLLFSDLTAVCFFIEE